MIYKTIEEWIERNPNHIGMLPIEVCLQIWGTKKKEWVGLTDEERKEIMKQQKDFWINGWELECMKTIEAKLKDKNI